MTDQARKLAEQIVNEATIWRVHRGRPTADLDSRHRHLALQLLSALDALDAARKEPRLVEPGDISSSMYEREKREAAEAERDRLAGDVEANAQDVEWALGVLRSADDFEDEGSIAHRATPYLERVQARALAAASTEEGEQ